MPNSGKGERGDEPVNTTATAEKPAAQPAFGEAALKEALAELGVGPDGARLQGGPAAGASAHEALAGGAAKTVSQVMGEITWLMTQSPRHKAIAIGDLEWLLMPAILLKQFRIYYSGERPVGVALWALVDDTVAKRIDAGDRLLAAAEWKSGPYPRIIDVVAPFGGEAEMRKQIAEVGVGG